jgi:hypothetical protein
MIRRVEEPGPNNRHRRDSNRRRFTLTVGSSGAVAQVLCLAVFLCAASATAQISATQTETVEETLTTMRANGTFEVKLSPLEAYNQAPEAKIGRMSVDKTFAGDLVGTSQGEMLTGGSPAEGSAGYVAIERVNGALQGRSGSFLLQHSGTITSASQELTITVVPGSGTGELEGIAGTLSIEIEDGKHIYDLEYTLPSSP